MENITIQTLGSSTRADDMGITLIFFWNQQSCMDDDQGNLVWRESITRSNGASQQLLWETENQKRLGLFSLTLTGKTKEWL